MENQRIQKLVKLAYIADIHGDYKIADRIFEKLAATPPPKPIQRMRRMEDLMKFLSNLGLNINSLESRIENLKTLKARYDDPALSFAKGYSTQDLQQFYDLYNKKVQELPALKKELASETAKDPSSRETLYAKTKVDNAELIIKLHEPFFGGLTEVPVPYGEIEKKLAEIQKELAKFKPEDLAELPSNDPQRVLIERLQRQFTKIRGEAEIRNRDTLEPWTTKGTSESTKVKEIPGLFKRRTTITETTTGEKSSIDFFASLRNVGKAVFRPLFTRQLDKFLLQRELRTGFGGHKGVEQIIKNSGNAIDIIQPLSQKLPDLIKLYDYKFFQAYQKAVEELTQARNVQISNARKTKNSPVPVTVPPKFDPIKNPKDFEAAAKMAAQEVRENTPEGTLIGVLFDTIESVLDTEVKKAQKYYSSLDPPVDDPSSDQLLVQISKNNPGFIKSIGLDNSSMQSLIEKRNSLTLEDFIELKAGKVSGISSEYWIVAQWLLGAGAVVGLPILFINSQAKKAQESIEKGKAAAGKAIEDVSGQTAAKQEEARINAITPSTESIDKKMEELRKRRRR